MKHIALLFGGNGSESAVSSSSAKTILASLKILGFKVTELPFDGDFIPNIQKIKPDIVFNAMHGKYGEDGVVPTILDFLQIPYTHSGRKASVIGINKEFTRQIAKSLGIPVIEGRLYTKEQLIKGEFEAFDESFLKPCNEGSAIGCLRFSKKNGLRDDHIKIIESIEDNFFLIEEFYQGKEITISVLEDKAIGGIEIIPKSGFYDYTSKYTKGMAEYIVEPVIEQSLFQNLKIAAEKIHKAIGASNFSRSDFLVKNSEYRFLEINTHPGVTETSLIPKAARAIGMSFEDLILYLINNAKFEKY